MFNAAKSLSDFHYNARIYTYLYTNTNCYTYVTLQAFFYGKFLNLF